MEAEKSSQVIPSAPAAPPQEKQTQPLNFAGSIWPKIAYELAVGVDDAATIAARHGLTFPEFRSLLTHVTFQKLLGHYVAEVRANGTSYREKAKVIAEDLLPDVYGIAKNPSVHPSIRLDAAKFVTGAAGLNLTNKENTGPGSGTRFTLQIVLGEKTERLISHGEVIEAEPQPQIPQ